ncbi:VQ motif-containing protein 4-like [Olea europaea var. sylvestris]|uniref:VQ motif-containing protein 4-like n=1 Tax=Olea europaea var. sylvestris TaxID=158386 RepID=UPI000C1D7835|nr:VQ motif-containing protein 4-like [Olea europaea var. sylvestris]
MENSPKLPENQSPFVVPSPNSHSSNSFSSSTTHINGLHHPSPPASQPSSPPITRSELNSPHPTTFVQADTSSFKQVVQMLTGSTETVRHSSRPEPVKNPIPPMKTGLKKDKSTSRLYERRNGLKDFKISPLGPGLVNTKPRLLSGYSGSPRMGTAEVLSPSILDFPSLVLSPVTPLIPDLFNRSPNVGVNDNNLCTAAEDRAIKEKGFYLHPSPANTPRDSEPRLLPLFPVTSPRVAGIADS